jgi:putative flippase GtrA
MKWAHLLPWRAIGRWWTAGLAFFFVGLVVLYLFMDVFRMPLLFGTLLAAEVTTIVRYAINDRWVFGHRRPAWTRFWQFHVACASGAAIWFAAANVLPRFGVHYLLASAMGSALSVFVGMGTSFMWIWRKRPECPQAKEAGEMAASVEAAHGG